MLYRVYGQTLESAMDLPELEEVPLQPADFRVSVASSVAVPPAALWSTLWQFSTGEPWVTVARTGAARVFRFGRFADVSLAGDEITVAPRGHARPETIRHLLLDQALPLALAARGDLVLHASAVQVEDRALLLMGTAGAGKSTLAALLARKGARVLADDGVVVRMAGEAAVAVPSYPGLRLFEDSIAVAGCRSAAREDVAEYTTKRRIVPGADFEEYASRVLPIAAIYALAEGAGEPRFDPLSSRDRSVELLRHAYRADAGDVADMRAQLDAVARIASLLDVWRLIFPRDLARAPDVADALLAHARAER